MTCGVITIDFEVGYPIKGHQYGRGFPGSAEIDADGSVVSICLEPFADGSPYVTLIVPFHRNVPRGDEVLALALAGTIEESYADEIAFKLMDWEVSQVEQTWVAAE